MLSEKQYFRLCEIICRISKYEDMAMERPLLDWEETCYQELCARRDFLDEANNG